MHAGDIAKDEPVWYVHPTLSGTDQNSLIEQSRGVFAICDHVQLR